MSATIAAPSANPTISDAEVDAIFAQVLTAEPLFSKAEMWAIEKNFVASGLARRGGLATLSLSGAKLISEIETDRESALAFANLSKYIANYLEISSDINKLLETAQSRLIVALANRMDCEEIFAEALGGDDETP
jgi:hypothetical protein